MIVIRLYVCLIHIFMLPERIYILHYSNGLLLMFTSCWKVNIAENPIAVMGLS